MNGLIKLDPIRYMIISFIMLFAGMLFYGFYNKLIILRLPATSRTLPGDHRFAQRRKTELWYWNGERFIKDYKELIYSANTQNTLTDLVASWLSYVEEENALPIKVTAQSVMLDIQKQTAFISFDKSPFKKEASTYTKLMFLEGLLKTLRESTIGPQKVQFLVNHRPMEDPHLDFAHAWAISGYTNS